ncbi:transposable element Tcb2 transposase [Trichonephila clavipes]|nr:transposable element Tcb2 transposase [Trichonephila clavipes]
MSERGATDSRIIGGSDKFRATAVRRNVVNHQTRGFKEREMLPDNQYQVDQEPQPLARTDIWRLNHVGLYARRPAACLPLPSVHKRPSLNWSLKHQHWSVGGWANVMFNDESQFSLSSDSWWGSNGMGRHGDGRPHRPPFLDTGSMTAQRYRDEILEPYVRLFRDAVGPDFIFMNDNAPCPPAVLIDDFHETENIQGMSWPAKSPDLNPIKHVWDMLGRQISALSHPPSSVTELMRALQETWNRLSP